MKLSTKLSSLALAVFSFTAITTFNASSLQAQEGANASCTIWRDEAVRFRGACLFQQFNGDGSFTISDPRGLIDGKLFISVTMQHSGVAEVRGLTTNGINSRWGSATRSKRDAACWVGQGFSVCAY